MITRETQTHSIVGIADRLPDLADYVRRHATSPGHPLRREYGRMKAATIRLAVLMNENDAARKIIEIVGE